MTKLTACGLVLPMLAAAALAQSAPPRTANTLAWLNHSVPEANIDQMPLDQVIDWLSNYAGVNVHVRWQRLEDVGIGRDTPISIKFRNLRFSHVMWLVMNEAGGPDVKLAYRAAGNLLILSTADDLGQEMLTRVYNVTDLLARVPNFRGGPVIDIANQGGVGAGNGQGVFTNAAGEEDEPPAENAAEQDPDMARLVELIAATIQPGSWEGQGGLGTIRSYRKQIIVRNNILVHQQLAGPVRSGAE